MTDRTLTPEVYGDFGLFIEQMGLRPKHIENTKTTPQSKVYPKEETSDWYKQGKECPF
jgi:hypothetical protein